MALVAVAVWISSPGPVLFRQPRRGLDGAVITVLKFRTLRADCEDRLGTRQVENDDPRLTRIGAVLRRTSLDELPQLVNVLRGDMSLVGPRPHAVGMTVGGRPNAELLADYMQRYAVKPGITGLAQVNGHRGRVDTAEQLRSRLDYDLRYIQHCSLLLDLRILFVTALQIITVKDTG
jgi:lipopolysaccharide/colanic/teichoic acid biosynthesis glycosyltransferase